MTEIYRTGHPINERVCDAVMKGFPADPSFERHGFTYGILRGSGEWAARRRSGGLATWVIDKGYFKPNHFDGYYRFSFCGTQDPVNDRYHHGIRFDQLGVKIEPWLGNDIKKSILVCPPTDVVADYFKVHHWLPMTLHNLEHYCGRHRIVVRPKGTDRSLEEDLQQAGAVVTFNSAVGWEALRRGIPVVSDPTHSTVGSFVTTTIADLMNPVADCNRRALFNFMANRQFTLQEIENGTARRTLYGI